MTTRDATLRLDVLGAGPAYTDRPGATGAAYLVRLGHEPSCSTSGQGSFPRLAGALEPSTLDAVVISHLHPDHFIDLVPLRHYLRWEFDPVRRVRVIGPAGLDDRLDALHGEPGFTAGVAGRRAPAAGHGRRRGADGRGRPGDPHRRQLRRSASRRRAETAAGLVYSGDCGRAEDLDVADPPGRHAPHRGLVRAGPGRARRGPPRRSGGRRAGGTDGAGRVLLPICRWASTPTRPSPSVDGPSTTVPVVWS